MFMRFLVKYFILLKLTLSLSSYSKIKFLENQTLNYSHFYQLSSKNIIGISSYGKITLRYNDTELQKYSYSPNDTINFLNFSVNFRSKNEYMISNTEILIPCVEINDKIQVLVRLDLNSSTVEHYSMRDIILTEKTNGHCGIAKFFGKSYLVSFSTLPFKDMNTTKVMGMYYARGENPAVAVYLFYGNHVMGTYDKTQGSCIFFDNLQIYYCLSLEIDCIYDGIKINTINLQTQILGKYTLRYSNLYHSFQGEEIFSIYLKKYNESLAIFLTFMVSNKFYVHFAKIKDETVSNIDMYYTDEVLRKGDKDFTKFLQIDEKHFIIWSSIDNIIYFYLFNVDLRKEINFPNNQLVESSYSDITLSYEQNYFIMVNQKVGKYLEIYEFNLMKCAVNSQIPAELNINVSLFYEDDNINSTSFIEIALTEFNKAGKNFILSGVLYDSIYDEYTEINNSSFTNFYKSFKFISLTYETFFLPFKYIIRKEYKNLYIPSLICSSFLIFSCYNSCEKCPAKGNSNLHYCTKCKEGFYSIKSQVNIELNLSFNCYQYPLEGYYLNEDDKHFYKCFELCKTCNEKGSEENHNCLSCKEGYILLSTYTGNISHSNCILSCNSNESLWYFDRNNKFICYNDTNQCPSGYKKKDENGSECIYINDEKEKEIEKIKTDFNSKSLDEKVISFFMDPKFFLENPGIIFNVSKNELNDRKNEKYFFDLYNSSNENDSHQIKECLILDDECLYKIKNEYIGYYAVILNIEVKEYPTNQIEYSFFTKEGDIIDLANICPNERISIIKEIKNESLNERAIDMMKSYNINLYNKNDQFFNDHCLSFTSDNGGDTPLSFRREDYFQDIEICENNCSVGDYDYENNKITCICQIKNNISSEIQEREKPVFTDQVSSSSLKYFTCYKNVFSSSIFTDPGFILSMGLASVKIVAYALLIKNFSLKKILPFPPIKIKKNKKDEILKNKKSNLASPKNRSININNIGSPMKQNLQTINFLNDIDIKKPSCSMNQGDVNVFDSKSIIVQNNNNLLNYNESIIQPNNEGIVISNIIENENNENNNSSNGDNSSYSGNSSNGSKELSILGYSSKLFIQKQVKPLTYADILKSKIIEINTFTNFKSPFEKFLKLVGYLSYISFILFFNTLLYNDNIIKNNTKEVNGRKFHFKNEYKKVLYSFLFGILVIILYRVFIHFITKAKYKTAIILVMILLIFDFILVYDVSAFTSSNENSAVNMIICVALSLAFNFVVAFIMSNIIYLLKRLADKLDNNNLYFFTELLMII